MSARESTPAPSMSHRGIFNKTLLSLQESLQDVQGQVQHGTSPQQTRTGSIMGIECIILSSAFSTRPWCIYNVYRLTWTQVTSSKTGHLGPSAQF